MKRTREAQPQLLLSYALGDEYKLLKGEWKDKVRELAYDIEDCIDIFLHQLHPREDKDRLVWKAVRKIKATMCLPAIKSPSKFKNSRHMSIYMIDVSTSGDRFIRI
uniref:Disease resistance N-terminal domain-containing protein n=1 Tax=Oryza rufipogon TaxID=4529 RepID=A0A0E0RH60_ORYRU